MLYHLDIIAGNLNLTIAVDGFLNELFIDGRAQPLPNNSIVRDVVQGFNSAPIGRVVAVNASNGELSYYPSGILASIGNGIVTDAEWKCVNASDNNATNWMDVEFDDSCWPSAIISNSYRRNISGISPSAVWIWTNNISPWATNVLCRRKFHSQLNYFVICVFVF